MSFLPTTCNAHHGVCFTQEAMYIWDIETYHSNCDFRCYEQASFQLIEPRTYIDEQKNKTMTITLDNRQIYQTLEGIWVADRPKTKRLFKTVSESIWNMMETPDLHQILEVSTNFLVASSRAGSNSGNVIPSVRPSVLCPP